MAIRRHNLSASERRGLEEIYRLAWADIEAAEPNDFTDSARADLASAFRYLKWVTDQR